MLYLYLSQTTIDKLTPLLGPNLGYDPNKVTIVVTPLFNTNE